MTANARFSVIIVEDESLIRRSMLNLIEWQTLNYSVIGEAPDGEIAWPLIQELHPDVVVTDIKMPFMDGLTLSRLIKENFPDIKIIILSGYDEFEYAQQAITIGVDRYILKPITKDQLTTVLLAVRHDIEKDKAKQYHLTSIENEVYQQEVNRFYERWMTGEMTSHHLVQKAQELHIDIIKKAYKLIQVMLLPKDTRMLTSQSWDVIRRIKQSMIEDITRIDDIAVYRSTEELTVFMIATDEPMDQVAYNVELNILKYFEDEYDQLIFLVATTDTLTDLLQLVSAYQLGRRILLEHSFKIITKQIPYSYIPPRQNSVLKIPHENPLSDHNNLTNVSNHTVTTGLSPFPHEWVEYKALDVFLIQGKETEISAIIQEIIGSITEEQWHNKSFIQYVILNIFFKVQNFIQQMGEDTSKFTMLPSNFEHLDGKQVLLDYLEKALEEVIEARDNRTANRYIGIIQRAIHYIEKHYHNPDLRLGDVADYVNVSPAYFTTVFSQQTGKTVIEFMTEVRMGKARLLLKTTSKSNFDIALEVGYRDPSYFSRTFKKYHGFSPNHYRKGEL